MEVSCACTSAIKTKLNHTSKIWRRKNKQNKNIVHLMINNLKCFHLHSSLSLFYFGFKYSLLFFKVKIYNYKRLIVTISRKMKERRMILIRPLSVIPVTMINGVRKIKQTLMISTTITIPIQRSKSTVACFTL